MQCSKSCDGGLRADVNLFTQLFQFVAIYHDRIVSRSGLPAGYERRRAVIVYRVWLSVLTDRTC